MTPPPNPARLRGVPEVAPRALGLIRVSDVAGRDELASPEIQRTAIQDHCARRGYTIAGYLEGIDESGSRSRSAWWAKLDEGVSRVEDGDVDVLVVWKFSRTARHRLKWAIALDGVESAGGRLESATEDFDITTSAGRFARGMLGELNAFEAERIGEGWKEAHEARVRAGRPATGRPKWGYVYDREAKLHRPDPELGPVLADLYRRYVAGASFYALVSWLNARGIRTIIGNTWSTEALRRVLDAGFGAGKFVRHGVLVGGIHEPVIDDTLWVAYLDARAERRGRPPRIERSRYVLSGLVRCGHCGGPMTAARYGNRLLYRCETRYRKSLEMCDMRYVRVELVEDGVLEWLRATGSEVRESADANAVASLRRVTQVQEAERLAREVLRGEEAMTRLVLQHAERPLPQSVYESALGELEQQMARLRAASEEAERLARRSPREPALAAAGLVDAWGFWPVEQRREALRSLISGVRVSVGESGVVVDVIPEWHRDIDRV